MPTSVADFLRNLEVSRLVEPDVLHRVRLRFGGDERDEAVGCARSLIREGVLTAYQANKLLNGATNGFFLGPYRVLRRLGEGGMGKVYLARRERDGQRFAIKVLPPRRALEDKHTLERFRREMELSRRVHHPNVAHTVEDGVEGDAHYMVVEYVPGDTLYHIVLRTRGGTGPLRVPDAARYFLQVIDGLEAAHEVGVIHRDIKPSNLMVTPDGGAKVLDLGLARLAGEDKNPLTHPNAVVGTLDYASPEQLADASRADRRSDLYSLGCTLYFALCGQAPFEGGDIVNKIFRHRMDEAEPIEKLAPGTPLAFGAIVRTLMAKEPSERYQTCGDLRRDLVRWTDPAHVRAFASAASDSAKAFRPPPPSLEEEDLRISDDPSSNFTLANLRELGSGEVSNAPLYRPAPPARPAVVIPPAQPIHPRVRDSARAPRFEDQPARHDSETNSIIQFALAAIVVGILAIVVITSLFL